MLQTYIPGSAFAKCCETPFPSNTLFEDVTPLSVGFSSLETYLPLVLELYSMSPMGSFSAKNYKELNC